VVSAPYVQLARPQKKMAMALNTSNPKKDLYTILKQNITNKKYTD